MNSQKQGMDEVQQRSVIRFMVMQNKTPKSIHEELQTTLGEAALAYSTVKKWAALFKAGRESVEDDERSGRPTTAVNEDKVKAVEDFIMKDRRVSVRHIAAAMDLSVGSVETIIHERLHMSKVSARWVPRMLTPEQRQVRKETSIEILSLFNEDTENFLNRLVTQDETWVPHFDPETKAESRQWKHSDSPPPRKFKVSKSVGKIMVSVFWDASGILLVDFLEKGRSINGEYYASLLGELRAAIVQKRRGKISRGVRLLQDNAPPHKSRVAVVKAIDCGFELLPHPPYSPDLAPSDFHLFPHMKKKLRGRVFGSDEETKNAVIDVLEGFPTDFFRDGLFALAKRCEKCVSLHEDYVEK